MASPKKALLESYKKYVISKKSKPSSLKDFLKYSRVNKEQFHAIFDSLSQLESTIWKNYYKKTFKQLKADKSFESMQLHEKHLSFLFVFIEFLSRDRDFVKICLSKKKENSFPKLFKSSLWYIHKKDLNWVQENALFGKQIPLNELYSYVLWKQSISTVIFWLKDNSENYVDTDQFIEKSTKVLTDLVNTSPLYSMVDLGKFVYQKFKPEFSRN